MPGLETLALTVVVGRGALHETDAQSGWAHLLEHMVFKAAGDRSAREIVEVIEAAGGHINAATGYDRTSFQVRALAGGLELAMAVVADLVFRPRLSAGDLAKEKRVIAQEIAEAADTPDDLVFELAGALAYAGHPLGRPVLGTRASVGRAKPAALAAFHASLYAPDRIVIAAAGAVEEGELLSLAERWFAQEPAAEPARRRPPSRPCSSAASSPPARPPGAGPPGLDAAWRPAQRDGSTGSLRLSAVRRDSRRRHVVETVPGGARAAGPRLRDRRLSRSARRRRGCARASSAAERAASNVAEAASRSRESSAHLAGRWSRARARAGTRRARS